MDLKVSGCVLAQVAFLAAVLFRGSSAIHCMQCSSLEDPLCGAGIAPIRKCEVDTEMCMTYVGKMPLPGMDMVIRECAEVDMGSFCRTMPNVMQDGGMQHEFCISTCHSNGCNGRSLWAKDVYAKSADPLVAQRPRNS